MPLRSCSVNVVGLLLVYSNAEMVCYQGHVGAGIVQSLEEAGTEPLVMQLQKWGLLPQSPRDLSLIGNSVIHNTSSSDSSTMPQSQAAAMQVIGPVGSPVHHWGFSHEHAFWGTPVITMILHYLSFAVIIKAACMGSNVLFSVSPYPIVKGIKEKGDTGEADAAPFVAIAFGGSQWCFYGLFAYFVTGKSGFLVLLYSNFMGAILGVYYTLQFHANCTRMKAIGALTMYYRIVSVLVLLQVGAMLVLPRERALFFSGLISSTCSVVQSCSSMITLPTVVRTKNARSIPLPLVIAALVSGILWIICGIILWDPWITFPNFIGVTSCCISLGMVWYYGTKAPEDELVLDSEENPAFSVDPLAPEPEMSYGACCGETGGTL